MKTNCESCINYIFDEEYNCYDCSVSLDEDEMGHMLGDSHYSQSNHWMILMTLFYPIF